MFDFLAQRFSSLFSSFSSQKALTQNDIAQVLAQIKDGLLEADVPYELVETFTRSIHDEVSGQKLITSLKPTEQLMKVVYEKLVTFLGAKEQGKFLFKFPSITMMLGLQGSGKTTTIGKLAWLYKGKKILLASVDFYRPAAIDQLEIVARNARVDFYRASSANPIQAAREIQQKYIMGRYDMLFLDTAGRLHVDNGMLEELRAIDADLQPAQKILVLDAMTGQESLNVAKAFDQAVRFSGAILSKTDSDTRGGAAFSFRYALKKPIIFIGTGEKIDDLAPFHPERAASRMLGMGDIKTLVEQADQKIKENEQRDMQRAFESGNFTLQDFAQQMNMMNRLGPISNLIKYIPGMSGMNIPQEALEQGEREMRRFKAIISSMTPKERIQPNILDGSRRKRIALGAGVEVAEINKLIQRFEQMKQYAKLVNKPGGLNNIFKGR
jgi:signal recognition particle subunit SRP54